MNDRGALLTSIVSAAGEEIARDFNAAFKSKSDWQVAHYIDALLVELIESGLLEADDHTEGRAWAEAVEIVYGAEDPNLDEED